MSYDSSPSASERRMVDRIDQAIDELLEEGYLIPTVGADGEVTVILSVRYETERCVDEVTVVEPDKFGKTNGMSWRLRCASIDPNPDHVHTATIRWLTKGT